MCLFDTFGIASSAFGAADAMMNVAASNLANVNTANYKAARVNLASGATDGVVVQSVSGDDGQGGLDENGEDASNVDPAHEVVGMMLAKAQYGAAALIVRATDEMLGTLLNIRH